MDYYNIFVDLATPLVGAITAVAGYIVYRKSKSDEKQEAAALIYLEIINAEQRVDAIKRSSSIEPEIYHPILPSNNWENNKHLFVNDLDANDYSLINNFYFDCRQIDKSISMLSVSKQLEFKENAIHSTLSQMAQNSKGNSETFEKEKAEFLKIIEKDVYVFPPKSAIDIIYRSKSTFQPISQLAAGQKIKKTAKLH